MHAYRVLGFATWLEMSGGGKRNQTFYLTMSMGGDEDNGDYLICIDLYVPEYACLYLLRLKPSLFAWGGLKIIGGWFTWSYC